LIEHAEILRLVEERRQALRERRSEKISEPVEISPKLVQDCVHANELGDGVLFAEIYQRKYRCEMLGGVWYEFDGRWKVDKQGHALGAVEGVSNLYLREAYALVPRIANAMSDDVKRKLKSLQDLYYRRINHLRTVRGRNNCLQFAATNNINAISITYDQFDLKPWLLPCQNGVIQLRTGEIKDGNPDDCMKNGCDTYYPGLDAPATRFVKILNECLGSEQLVEYFGKIVGCAISGKNNEHILPIFWGQGRNGKSIIVEIICYVLGELAGPIQAEVLLDQGRVKNSSAPSPDIMALKGMRIVIASESDEGRRVSSSKIKWLTGGDTLVGRYPHDKCETRFKATHQIILLTNNKPHAPAEDFAFWERVRLIPFLTSFVDRTPAAPNERPADKNLLETLKAEAPGILSWIVRGCLAWQRDGLKPPAAVTEATKEYRKGEDTLAEFIDECCYVGKDVSVGATDLYKVFFDWWESYVGSKPPSHKKFGTWMAKRSEFKKEKSRHYVYYGISIAENVEFPAG